MHGAVSTRHLNKSDKQAMGEVIRRAFGNAGSSAEPLPPDRFVIIAETGGKIVGHVSVRPMLFHFNGKVVRGNVLHMVATDPGYQHKGIGLKMLEAAKVVSTREGMIVSVLETPFPGFYALRGWMPLAPRTSILISRDEVNAFARQQPVEHRSIDLGSPRVEGIEAIVELRHRHFQGEHLVAAGNPAYMKALLDKHGSGSVVTFFHEVLRDGNLVGYLLGEREGMIKEGEPLSIVVKEWIMDEASPAEVMAVVNGLLDFDGEFTRVEIRLPVARAIEQVLLDAGGHRIPRGGNIDMAILPPGCGVDPASVSPRYDSSLFQAHLTEMNIT